MPETAGNTTPTFQGLCPSFSRPLPLLFQASAHPIQGLWNKTRPRPNKRRPWKPRVYIYMYTFVHISFSHQLSEGGCALLCLLVELHPQVPTRTCWPTLGLSHVFFRFCFRVADRHKLESWLLGIRKPRKLNQSSISHRSLISLRSGSRIRKAQTS